MSRDEQERAVEILVDRGLMFWKELAPEPPLADMDINRDGAITEADFRLMKENFFDEDIDIGLLNHIIGLAGWVSFPDAVYQPVPRPVSTLIDTYADGNSDGTVDEREQQIIMYSLSHEHDAQNYFDRLIDDNRDGTVHWSDIQLILQASAMGWELTGEEVLPPYEAVTLADVYLDGDRNGRVDRNEIDTAVAVLAGDLDYLDSLSNSLRNLLDADNSGTVNSAEISRAKRLIAFPRGVDETEDLDRESDANGDGFISEEELGISAGVTNKGPTVPFNERIARYRRRGSADLIEAELESAEPAASGADNKSASAFYENLSSVKNGILAVLSIEPGTEGIKDEASVATIFVENAFVNIGNVSVVDRDHLMEIRREVELNLSGMIDEESAVKIGKLAGADIIAVGSISKIEDSYYLYLQLISVETGKILGSSIAESGNIKNYLEMSIQVVSNLF